MNNTEFWGYLVVFCVPVIGSFVALMKPIINLNINIQKLADAVSTLNSDKDEIKSQITKHEDILNDHETRLTLFEYRDKQINHTE